MRHDLNQDLSLGNSWRILLQIFMVSVIASAVSSQLTGGICFPYMRRPEYTDIAVECGTNSISLAIQICPAVYTGYNESLLLLNNIIDNPACKGIVDISVTPPVLRFSFPLTPNDTCGSSVKTTSAPGTGIFSDFSNIQTVNFSGVVKSYDPTMGPVTYNTELKYFYSCAYPLEYLINNTQIDVSSTSIAMKDNNGSFISTLNLRLFRDINYTQPLVIPPLGIELRTNVFVQVNAINLTSQYFVLLDRCFASTSLNPENATFFNLFVPCYSDQMTNIIMNGESSRARFYFPAFRFMQQNQTISTYYLHCITRLCERTACGTFRQCFAGRRKRDADSSGIPASATITSPPITTRIDGTPTSYVQDTPGYKTSSTSPVGKGVAVGILVFVGIMIIGIAAVYTRRFIQSRTAKMRFG